MPPLISLLVPETLVTWIYYRGLANIIMGYAQVRSLKFKIIWLIAQILNMEKKSLEAEMVKTLSPAWGAGIPQRQDGRFILPMAVPVDCPTDFSSCGAHLIP